MTISGSIFKVETLGGADIVEFTESHVVDGAEIKRAGDEIYHFLKGRDDVRLVLDFQKVQHLSSAALGMIVALNKVVNDRKGQLRIANVSPDILGVFKITKLHKVVKIKDTTADALSSFK